jgi:hypothetical protein
MLMSLIVVVASAGERTDFILFPLGIHEETGGDLGGRDRSAEGTPGPARITIVRQATNCP